MQTNKLSLKDIKGDLKIYFNWSANVLMPVSTGSADVFLAQYRSRILTVAQKLLAKVNFIPTPIYRGILLKENVNTIQPHKNLKYLSFSDKRSIAEQFADVKGFGSHIVNLKNPFG